MNRLDVRKIGLALAIAIALALSACATTNQAPASRNISLRAMTFNIRLDLASDGANAWPQRKQMVAELIRYEAADIVGLQEVLLHQKHALESELPAYEFIGVARDDGLQKGEFSPLAFNRTRFEVLESGTFWLSPTPDVPAKAWDAAYPRIATWAVLRDRRSGQSISVLNTHFDHVGKEARVRSAEQIAAWVSSRKADRDVVVVMGDFNAPLESEPHAILANEGASGLRDSRSISKAPPYGPEGTFTAFRIDNASSEIIDHIFVSDAFAVERHATISQHWHGQLPSDHYPVVADLTYRAVN